MIDWSPLATQFLQGIVMAFFWTMIKDTIFEIIGIILLMIAMGLVVYTDPVAIGISIVQPGLWGWVSFFIGTIFGKVLGSETKEKFVSLSEK